jgi:membrane protein DedA with SNARE-associated domain
METIIHWITEYGYGGLFVLLLLGVVGLPIPDEIILLFSGYLIYKGKFSFITASLVAFSGSVCGISISYTLGRTLGLFLLCKYGPKIHITQERLNKAHAWFERVGRWGLLFGYFVPGFRHIMAYLSGTTKLQVWEFALFAYSGAILWTLSFIITGILLGDKWEKASEEIHRHLVTFSLVVLVALGVYYLARTIIRRRKSQ